MDVLNKYVNKKIGENYHFLFEEIYGIIIDDINIIKIDLLEALYLEFLKIEEKKSLLLEDLRNVRGKYCFESSKVIYSIKCYEFELNDISKYSSNTINEKYLNHLKCLKGLLENSNYKEYIESIPNNLRSYKFEKFTGLPKKGSLLYYYRNGKALWDIEDRKYWEYLRKLWNENLGADFTLDWYKLFVCNRIKAEYFMTEEERTYFEALPEKIIIYKGCLYPKPTKKHPKGSKVINLNAPNLNNLGFLYTLSKEIGMSQVEDLKKLNEDEDIMFQKGKYWFRESELFEKEVFKKDIFAYINHNKKFEILIFNESMAWGFY